MLRLDLADAADLARDPTVRATVEAIERQRPARPGDHTTMIRFFIDAERNQSPSRTLNLGPVLSIQTLLTDPAIGWDVLCWIDSGAMDPLMEFIDYQRLSGGEHRIGSTELRRLRSRLPPSAAVLSGSTSWRTASSASRSPPPSRDEGDLLALSFDEFASSVGQALKDLHRRDRLAANPLCRSRLVAEGSADEDARGPAGGRRPGRRDDPRASTRARTRSPVPSTAPTCDLLRPRRPPPRCSDCRSAPTDDISPAVCSAPSRSSGSASSVGRK